MANPMYLFFSSTFSYENLALPMAAFVVWWLGHTRRISLLPVLIAAALAMIGVVITHHVVGLALSLLLVCWWLAQRFIRRTPIAARRGIGVMALLTTAVTLVWFFVVAKPAASYLLTNNLLPAVRQTSSLVLGKTSPRHLYTSGGLAAPEWQTFAGFAAVGILLVLLPFAFFRAWRRRDHASMAVAVGVAALFAFSLVPRLAPAGVAISARSWEYIFTGVGCVVGLLATDAWSPQHRMQRWWSNSIGVVRSQRALLATILVTVVFVGNITIGTAFYMQLPESSHPTNYPWTVQPDVVAASAWALSHLGMNRRFGASAIDALALDSYGEQNTIPANSAWPIYFPVVMDRKVVQAIKESRVQYLMLDWRMTRSVPPTPGYYFSVNEPGAVLYQDAFPAAGLQKFSNSCSTRIYESGPIEIIDVVRIENGSCVPVQSVDIGSGTSR